MKIWNNAPLIRLILPFISGIILAIISPYQSNTIPLLIFSALFIVAFIITLLQLNFSYINVWLYGLLINSALALIGYQLTILKTEKIIPNHFSHFNTNYAYVHITQAPIKKNKSVKTVAEVLAVKYGNKWYQTKGKTMLYFQKDEKSIQLNYGDNIIIKPRFAEISTPQNPNEFNYKNYLSYHNIYYQAFIKSSAWVSTGINTGNKLVATAIKLRNSLLQHMSDHNIKGNEFAVGSALLLGYEDELNPELLSAYSGAGVIHILSVSGLHVGIVYLVFNWLFSIFEKIKKGIIFKTSLLLITLWFYAALTSFSPSVLRATTMFTFIIIAQAFNRNTNIYNTLAASAFLLLLINPFVLMDVGFQLSYLAVIGIITIHPKLYTVISFDNRLADITWKMTSVSIAAQIATFPLCLYYFHQFPNYFILANMIAIPLSTLIIYLGILFFLFLKFSILASVIAFLFKSCVDVLNNAIVKFENLPYASFTGVYINAFEMLTLYGIIILLCYYLIQPKFNFLMIVSVLIILLLSIQLTEQHKQQNQKKLIVYNISKASAIDFISGKSNVLLTDSSFSKNKQALSFNIKNNWDNLSINNTQITNDSMRTSNLFTDGKYIQFYNKRIVLLKKKNTTDQIPAVPLNIDYLILSDNCELSIPEILKIYHPKLIVFDSSNNNYQLQKWKTGCIKNNKAFYSVVNSGALVVDI